MNNTTKEMTNAKELAETKAMMKSPTAEVTAEATVVAVAGEAVAADNIADNSPVHKLL